MSKPAKSSNSNKAFRVILLTLGLILNTQGIAKAAVSDNWNYASTKPTEPAFGFDITDDNYAGNGFSSIYGSDIKVGVPTTNIECSSVDDPQCANANSLRYSIIVPPCSSASDPTDVCIKSLKTADSAGVMQAAALQYEINTHKIAKDPAHLLSAGGGTSVWKGASSTGGTLDYSVTIDLEINLDRGTDNKFSNRFVVGFNAQVMPTKVETGNYYPNYWKHFGPNNWVSIEPQVPAGAPAPSGYFKCEWVDLGRCGVADTFHTDQKIDLTLQMDNSVTGWLFGRMKDTEVSSVPLSAHTSLLDVVGSSINVPTGLAWVPLSAVANGSPALQEYARFQKIIGNDITSKDFVWGRPSNHPDLFQFPTTGLFGGEIFTPSPSVAGLGMLAAIEPWLKTFRDTPVWRFQGMTPASFWGADQSIVNSVYRCTVADTTKLHGMMTTNAMGYSWSPPALKDGFLTYKVGGAHTDVDGSLYKGTYNLSMNLDSAKCIYGFSDAPIMASVSVIDSSGGAQDVGTQVVNVRNNWMNLSASNFTFSTPTIRFKLTQEAAKATPNPAPKPISSAEPAPAQPLKLPLPIKTPASKSLTCVKGKIVKKISTSKCPVGYKPKVG